MNKFRKWVVDFGGTEAVGRAVGKHPRAVYYWLHSKSSPPARVMQELVKAGKGAFTYQDVIDCTVNRKK